MVVRSMLNSRWSADVPRWPKMRPRDVAKYRIAPEASHAQKIAHSQLDQRSGCRAISSSTVAIAEGPAIRGTASGTTKGSPSGVLPKISWTSAKIIFRAIKNRMMPLEMLKAGSVTWRTWRR